MEKGVRELPRVRLKFLQAFWLLFVVNLVAANRPPRFLIDGQSEIVVRLKEGSETPIGESN